jgi:spermidine synthase
MRIRHLSIPLLLVLTLAVANCTAQERRLYQGKSEFNTIIVTENPDGVRRLLFEEDGAIQTEQHPQRPQELRLAYAHAIMSAFLIVPEPRRILIVGLGGGSMPRFIRHINPEVHIDNVELDPAVVEVAQKFFNFREDERMKAHVGDGRKFIEETDNRYDIIFLDAFGADEIPYSLATREFLQAVRGKLADGGLVAANIWGPYANRLYYSMLRTYLDVFPELRIIRARNSGNQILLVSPQKRDLDLDELLRRARQFQTSKGVDFDLAGIIETGYRQAPTLPRDARILVDAEAPGR